MTEKAADPRFKRSRVTAFYPAAPKRVTRSSPPVEFVVVVTTGALADHHRFDDRADAEAFVLSVDPDYPLPEPTDHLPFDEPPPPPRRRP